LSLITLHKTEAHFSPTTMYRDYAVNERLFPGRLRHDG